jgi:syntaxin 18
MHRESVLWYLRQKLQEAGSAQAAMMETRITREVEKNKSALYKARGRPMPELGGFDAPLPDKGKFKAELQEEKESVEDGLTEEQLQIYEKENQDMLKHYEATLDQVKYV